jgi:hypothetical protein
VDAVTVALVAALISLVVGALSTAATAWSAHKTAKTAREGRIDQRRADAYLQVLSIVEREGHWIETWVANFGNLPDPHDEYAEELVRPPAPEVCAPRGLRLVGGPRSLCSLARSGGRDRRGSPVDSPWAVDRPV